jgi:hypothetical protein
MVQAVSNLKTLFFENYNNRTFFNSSDLCGFFTCQFYEFGHTAVFVKSKP